MSSTQNAETSFAARDMSSAAERGAETTPLTHNPLPPSPSPPSSLQPHNKRLREEDIHNHDEAMLRRLSGGGFESDRDFGRTAPAAATGGDMATVAADSTAMAAFPPPFAGLRPSVSLGKRRVATSPTADANTSNGGVPADSARAIDYSVRATEGSNDSSSSEQADLLADDEYPAKPGEIHEHDTTRAEHTSSLNNNDDEAPPVGEGEPHHIAPPHVSDTSTPKAPARNVHIKSRAGGGAAAAAAHTVPPLKIFTPSASSNGDHHHHHHHHHSHHPAPVAAALVSTDLHHHTHHHHHHHQPLLNPAAAHSPTTRERGGNRHNVDRPLTQHDRFTALFEKALVEIVPLMSPFSPNAPEGGGGEPQNVTSGQQPQSSATDARNDSASTSSFPRPITVKVAAPPPDAHSLASDIATALLEPTVKDPSARVKTLLFHLKDSSNVELRNSLRKGRLSGRDFVHLDTYNQLFNKIKQADVTATAKASDEHKDLRRVSKKDPILSSMYECPQCRQRRHTLVQVQTRSGDEPMTEFCQCVMCDRTWRVGE